MIAPAPPTTIDLTTHSEGIDGADDQGRVREIARRGTRAELEAQQKRYMDERFGRDRAMNRKRRA